MSKPLLGNLIGWMLSKTVYRPVFESQGLCFPSRLIPKWAAGQTWGDFIFIKHGYRLEEWMPILRHELIHVQQWHRYGWWGLGFMLRYGWELVVRGYENNRLEVEARGE